MPFPQILMAEDYAWMTLLLTVKQHAAIADAILPPPGRPCLCYCLPALWSVQAGCINLVPAEIMLKIVSKIKAGEPFTAYILKPTFPEGACLASC